MDRLTDKVAVVTGAAQGIGKAIAETLAQRGAHVVIADIKLEKAEATAQAIAAGAGRRAIAVQCNVADSASAAALIDRTLAEFGRMDILINNAGVHLEKESASLEELNFSDGHLERTLAVNAFGPLRVAQQFLPLLEKGHDKLIINISSEAGSIADCWRSREFAYCMSKAALNMQSKLLRNYLAPRGFRVLAVHPGWMRTDMGGQSADISPDQAAAGIFDLVRQGHQPSDEIYLDYQAKPLRW